MAENKITLSEGIEKLKALIFGAEKPEEIVTTEQKFTDQKLQDGTLISYDAEELAVGVIVFLLDETGQRLPLPKGDYVTEAGDTFTVVDDMGTIDNVVVAPEAPEPVEPDASTPAPVAPVANGVQNTTDPAQGTPKRVIKSQVVEHVFSLETENEVFEIDLSAMFKKVEDENKALKDLNKEMFSVIEKLSEQPTATPTESKKKFNASEFKSKFKAELKALETQMSNNNI